MEKLKRVPADVRREEAPAAPTVAEPEMPGVPANAYNCSVRVIHGASDLNLDLAGQTVAQVRPVLDQMLGADRRSPLLVNGRPVRPDYVLASSDVLELVKRAGEKGSDRGCAV